MTRIFALLSVSFLAAYLAAQGCAHIAPVVEPPVVDCAKAVSPDILPAVESALVADDWVTELTALATKYGLCVLNRAVELIGAEAHRDAGFASTDVNAKRKAEHAAAWLAAHPTP